MERPPYVSLYDTELKTADRQRIVPLPFRTERLKQLLELMDEGQESALPPSVVKVTDAKSDWVTSESNISRQLNDYMKMCDPDREGVYDLQLTAQLKILPSTRRGRSNGYPVSRRMGGRQWPISNAETLRKAGGSVHLRW